MSLKNRFRQLNAAFYKAFLELAVVNRYRRSRLKANYIQNLLRPYVQTGAGDSKNAATVPKILWLYWEQGWQSDLPPLVEAAQRSVAKQLGDFEVRRLDRQNYKQFVQLPDWVERKYESGAFKLAHFTDLLRTALLLEHGGVWADATVWFSAPIPDAVLGGPLTVLQNDPSQDRDRLNMASYFIAAVPGEAILRDTMATLAAYWQDRDYLANYFLFLHAFTLVSQAPCHRATWQKMPVYNYNLAQQLQMLLGQKFSQSDFKVVTAGSFLHKLTYKARLISRQKQFDPAGTYFEAIVKSR